MAKRGGCGNTVFRWFFIGVLSGERAKCSVSLSAALTTQQPPVCQTVNKDTTNETVPQTNNDNNKKKKMKSIRRA